MANLVFGSRSMADTDHQDSVVEELLQSLLVDGPTALRLALSKKSWAAIKDDFFLKLDYISNIDQLRYILAIIAASFKQEIQDPQIAFDAYEFLCTGLLWEAVGYLILWDQCPALIGTPDAVCAAEEGIRINWGCEPYEGFPEEVSFVDNGFLTCLLHRLSCIVDQNEATRLLRRQVLMREVIPQIVENISNDNLMEMTSEDLKNTARLASKQALAAIDNESNTYVDGEITIILVEDVIDALNVARLAQDSGRHGQNSMQPTRDIQTTNTESEHILDEIRRIGEIFSEGLCLFDTIGGLEVSDDDDSYQTESEEETMEYPCFCTGEEYSGQGLLFGRFINQKGWLFYGKDELWLIRQDGTDAPIEEVNALMQAWLIFGVLHEIFGSIGITVRSSDFIREDCEGRHLTFILLDRYIAEFVNVLRKDRRNIDRRARETLTSCLSDMEKFSIKSPIMNASEEALQSVQQLFRSLSAAETSILGNLEGSNLTKVLEKALKNCQFDIPLAQLPSDAVDFPHPDWYIVGYEKMQNNGWCPRDINMLLNEPIVGGDAYCYFASSIDRRRSGRQHNSCNKDKCVTRTLVEKTYKPWHYRGCTSCQLVDFAIVDVTEMLQNGRYPRVSFTVANQTADGGQECRLAVIDSGPFVAVSHVWSDGLGNVNTNALPLCQVKRLRSQAAALFQDSGNFMEESSSVNIWIDTLCVPLEDKGRRLALSQLGKAYADAEFILVLDDELQHVSLDCSEEEKLTRILVSEWMHRLWTMEEASFGVSKLRFQFRDGTYILPDFESRLAYFRSLNFQNVLRSPRLIYDITGTFIDRLPFQSKFALKIGPRRSFELCATYEGQNPLSLIEGIQHRMTSKAEDEFLCISSLMGLNVKKVAQFRSNTERAVAFYRMLADHSVPLSAQILFSKEPKLSGKEFRWTPASLSTLHRYGHHPFFEEEITGNYFDSTGLWCQFPGYQLVTSKRQGGGKCLVTKFQGRYQSWQTDQPNTIPGIAAWKREPPSLSDVIDEDDGSGQLAIVVNKSITSDDSPSSDAATGALVYIYREAVFGENKTRVKFARYLLPLWNIEEDENSQDGFYAEATWLSPVTWCIG